MKITFKLFATLQHKLPPVAVSHAVDIDVDENLTIHQVLNLFTVTPEEAHLVLVNGIDCDCRSRDQAGALKEGDVLAVWPEVAGG